MFRRSITLISASLLPNFKQSRLNQTSTDKGIRRRILLLVDQYRLQHQGISYRLSATSTPWEVADNFIPFSDGNVKKRIIKDAFSFKLLTKWTNNKAHMAGGGKKFYKEEWLIFSDRE